MSATDAPEPRPGAEAQQVDRPAPRRRDPRTLRPRPAGTHRAPVPRRDVADPLIDCAVYVDGLRQEQVDHTSALQIAKEKDGFVWLGLYEPTEAELAVYAEEYGL